MSNINQSISTSSRCSAGCKEIRDEESEQRQREFVAPREIGGATKRDGGERGEIREPGRGAGMNEETCHRPKSDDTNDEKQSRNHRTASLSVLRQMQR